MSKDENKKKNDVKNNSRFFKESKAELKKVSWPKPKALVNDTATVIVIVLVVAAIVAVLDLAFLWINESLIIKTEEKIVNSNTVDDIENPIEIPDYSDENEQDDSTQSEEPSDEDSENNESENEEATENNEAE